MSGEREKIRGVMQRGEQCVEGVMKLKMEEEE